MSIYDNTFLYPPVPPIGQGGESGGGGASGGWEYETCPAVDLPSEKIISIVWPSVGEIPDGHTVVINPNDGVKWCDFACYLTIGGEAGNLYWTGGGQLDLQVYARPSWAYWGYAPLCNGVLCNGDLYSFDDNKNNPYGKIYNYGIIGFPSLWRDYDDPNEFLTEAEYRAKYTTGHIDNCFIKLDFGLVSAIFSFPTPFFHKSKSIVPSIATGIIPFSLLPIGVGALGVFSGQKKRSQATKKKLRRLKK